jgi:hypothetical protein
VDLSKLTIGLKGSADLLVELAYGAARRQRARDRLGDSSDVNVLAASVLWTLVLENPSGVKREPTAAMQIKILRKPVINTSTWKPPNARVPPQNYQDVAWAGSRT